MCTVFNQTRTQFGLSVSDLARLVMCRPLNEMEWGKMMTVNTHLDWNPSRVDLLSTCGISRHFQIPLGLIWQMTAYDATFPHYQRDSRGCRCYRLPDVAEYLLGERLNET